MRSTGRPVETVAHVGERQPDDTKRDLRTGVWTPRRPPTTTSSPECICDGLPANLPNHITDWVDFRWGGVGTPRRASKDGQMNSSKSRWVPPNLTPDQTKDFLAIKQGIPQTARRPIARWLVKSDFGSSLVSTRWISQFELEYGRPILSNYREKARADDLWRAFEETDEHDLVAILDYQLYKLYYRSKTFPLEASTLEAMLFKSGAGWHVVERAGYVRLERRLSEGVALGVDKIVSASQQSSKLLQDAWNAAYGTAPDSTKSYSSSVKAVEAAAIPVISPNNDRATLGTCIRDIASKPDKWSFTLTGENQHPVEQVRQMMKLLWGSQDDRHAGNKPYEPVSLQQARTAVMLATTLVGWFDAGHFGLGDLSV